MCNLKGWKQGFDCSYWNFPCDPVFRYKGNGMAQEVGMAKAVVLDINGKPLTGIILFSEADRTFSVGIWFRNVSSGHFSLSRLTENREKAVFKFRRPAAAKKEFSAEAPVTFQDIFRKPMAYWRPPDTFF